MFNMYVSLSGEQIGSAMADDVEEAAMALAAFVERLNGAEFNELGDHLETADKSARANLRFLGELLRDRVPKD